MFKNLIIENSMKIENLKFKIGLLIGLFVYLFIGSIPANAEALSLSIDPTIIEIHATSPSVTKANLTIQNKSDNPVELVVHLKPFKANLENGQLEYLSSEDKDTSFLLRNVQIMDNDVAVDSLKLGPAQQKNLAVNINIPQDLKISDYYFSVIFISNNNSTPESTASLNQLGIATNVLLSVGAKEAPNAVLEEFSSGVFYQAGPVPFTIRIKNKGAHFIKPRGEVIVRNMFGQNIGRLELFSVNVLTNSVRTQEVLWKEDFLLGLYTATLNIYMSEDGPNFTKSINFLAFPTQGFVVIILIIIAGIAIKSRLKHRLSNPK